MKPAFDRIGIIASKANDRVCSFARELITWLEKRKHTVHVDAELAQALQVSGVERTKLVAQVDLLISLGGDGTVLRAARLAFQADVPIFPVHIGALGFLADVKPEQAFEVLDGVLAGKYIIGERLMLQVTARRGEQIIFSQVCLNDAVIGGSGIARLVRLRVESSGQYIATYRADGLIVATATGSTAYSLSAGGPILHPSVHAIVVTPVAPHALTNRPLVLPENRPVTISVLSEREPFSITIDGQEMHDLATGDTVSILAADHKLRLIHPEEGNYFKTIREKLGWSGEAPSFDV